VAQGVAKRLGLLSFGSCNVRSLGGGCLTSVSKLSTPCAIWSLVCPQHLALLLIAPVFGLVLLAIVLWPSRQVSLLGSLRWLLWGFICSAIVPQRLQLLA
jgi:hypothetical protein